MFLATVRVSKSSSIIGKLDELDMEETLVVRFPLDGASRYLNIR